MSMKNIFSELNEMIDAGSIPRYKSQEKSIHYDLEQTLREARRESGMTLESIASVIAEVLDRDELKALIEQLYASVRPDKKEAK